MDCCISLVIDFIVELFEVDVKWLFVVLVLIVGMFVI